MVEMASQWITLLLVGSLTIQVSHGYVYFGEVAECEGVEPGETIQIAGACEECTCLKPYADCRGCGKMAPLPLSQEQLDMGCYVQGADKSLNYPNCCWESIVCPEDVTAEANNQTINSTNDREPLTDPTVQSANKSEALQESTANTTPPMQPPSVQPTQSTIVSTPKVGDFGKSMGLKRSGNRRRFVFMLRRLIKFLEALD